MPPSPPKSVYNVTSPSTSPSPLPPAAHRVLSPPARPSTVLGFPSTLSSSTQPRPAPDLPSTHMPVISPESFLSPSKFCRPRPSSSPHSLAPSCPYTLSDPPLHPSVPALSHPTRPRPCRPPPDPFPPSSSLPISSFRRHKRRDRDITGRGNSRPSHGTLRGQWTGSQIIDALYSLSDTNTMLKFSRLPGSGVHRQLRFRWKGNTVLVNAWHTGRVHLQGYGAGDLAKLLSGMAPSFSSAQSRSVSPQSDGDSSGVGNSLFPFFLGLFLVLLWGIHLIAFGLARFFPVWSQVFRESSRAIQFWSDRTFKSQGRRVTSGTAQRSSLEESRSRNAGAGSRQCAQCLRFIGIESQ